MSAPERLGNFIDGGFSEPGAGAGALPIENPATGAVLGEDRKSVV